MAAGTASLCSTLLFVGVFVFVSAEQKTIIAESGQSITLTCRAPNNILVVEWNRADLGEEYVFVYRDGHFLPDNQHPSFENRVELQDTEMKDGDVSVILKNVNTDDNGTYKCRVFMRETRSWKRISIIYLRVDSPGHPGGLREDGSDELRFGLSVSVVLLVAAAVVFLIYRELKE